MSNPNPFAELMDTVEQVKDLAVKNAQLDLLVELQEFIYKKRKEIRND